MSTEPNISRVRQFNDFIRIKDMFYLCLLRWKWFAVSLLVTVAMAWLYIQRTPPIYVREASILLKNVSKERAVADEIVPGVTLPQKGTSINDEIMAIQSPFVMKEVVKRLNLDVEYPVSNTAYDSYLYGNSLPVKVYFIDCDSVSTCSLVLHLLAKNEVELSGFSGGNASYNGSGSIKAALSDTVITPIGKICVKPTVFYKEKMTSVGNLMVVHRPVSAVADAYLSRLTVKLSDEKTSLITLSIIDMVPQRAEDILNTLISAYSDIWMKDQNAIAVSSSAFIRERLEAIERDLGIIDDNISTFKSENLIPDVQAASGMYMAQSQGVSSQIQTLTTQQSMVRYVRRCLTKNMGTFNLLPANSGINNSIIEGQIAAYNALVLQRNNLMSNGNQHPQVAELERSLKAMRTSIIESVDNQDASLTTLLNDLQRNEQEVTAHIVSNPAQAKYLLSVERQQKVKETLYLFLLQKQEENELGQTAISSNVRIIRAASGSLLPIAPLKQKILLLAFAVGLFIPVVIIFIVETTNTMVRNRKDLEWLSLPFVGELPLYEYPRKKSFSLKKAKSDVAVVVQEKKRNIINEAFRVIRTNLEFIMGREGKTKVIMLTSFNTGSGKTFVSLNLATSFAINGKKVLVIDLDMRKASMSRYVGSQKEGISDFLNGAVANIEDIIFHEVAHSNLDFIPVGTIPPNPAELLSGDYLERLLNVVRAKYDCIFIDCPPVEVVADASLINKFVDMTLFVVRAGLLDKSMLPDVEKLYTERKCRNMCVLLNGTEVSKRYAYSKYGYNYGYGVYAPVNS